MALNFKSHFLLYSVLPSFEYFPVSNNRVFDKISWYWDRHLAQNIPSVIIHIYSSFISSQQYLHQTTC